MGFFLKEEETRNEDLGGKGKKNQVTSVECFAERGFGVMQCATSCSHISHLGCVKYWQKRDPPRTSNPTHSLLFTPQLALHVTHLNNQHRNQAAANQRASMQPSHSTLSLLENGSFFPQTPTERRCRFVSAPALAPFTSFQQTGFDTNQRVSSLVLGSDTVFRQGSDRPCQQA